MFSERLFPVEYSVSVSKEVVLEERKWGLIGKWEGDL